MAGTDVVRSMRSVVIGTAGHIDHGKSALVRALTGIDPDRLAEEKVRGITIDLGFAHLQLGLTQVAFVDVPGHERFVRNMLAGVGGVDAVMLVVAADESVMPQTREHFDICRLLRVPVGLIALTKTDLVDDETVQLAALEVKELVTTSFLRDAPLVPVSARTGEGLDELRRALAAVAEQATARTTEGASRLPIDRVFTMKGFGTVVTGTLISGRIRVGESLEILPAGRHATVRGLQVHGCHREQAVAGERTAVNLASVEVHDLVRGHVLTSGGSLVVSRIVDAAVEQVSDSKPIRFGTRVRFHLGASEVMGRVAVVGGVDALEGSGYARIRLERPAALRRGDRFILRSYSPPATIAGGVILDPSPPRTAVRHSRTLARCRRLDSGLGCEAESEAAAVALMIEEAGSLGFPIAALTTRGGLSPMVAGTVQSMLIESKRVVGVGDILVVTTVLDRLKQAIVARLTAHHRQDRLSAGLPREEARHQLLGAGHPAIFERAVDELATAGVIAGSDRLSLAAHRVQLSTEEEEVAALIEQKLRTAGLTPPDVAALHAAAGADETTVDRVIGYLQRRGDIVKINALFFHERALDELKTQVRALSRGGQAVTLDVTGFKERFGVTRKFAIPLLEFLDRERVTRRTGDRRLVL